MIEALKDLATFVVGMFVLFVFVVIWDLAEPLRRRIRETAVRAFRRGVDPVERRWRAQVTERTARHIRNAVIHLDAVVPGVPTRGWCGVVNAIERWCRFSPLSSAMHMAMLAIPVWGFFQIGKIGAAVRYVVNHPPDSSPRARLDCRMPDQVGEYRKVPSTGDCVLNPLGTLWGWGRGLVGWVQETAVPSIGSAVTKPWADPAGIGTILFAAFLLLMLVRALQAALPFFRSITESPLNERPSDTRAQQKARKRREAKKKQVRGGEAARWSPVKVLLSICGDVGAEYKRQESRGALDAPHVSLEAAERAVWTAWRNRHGPVRRDQQQQLKKHAAQVVGALRAMEAQQYSSADPRKTLEEAAAMLLKIAQRYAEGRTLALLDPADLEGIEEAVNREWMRAAALGVIVTAIATGLLAAGLPEAAATPLIGVLSLITWGTLYGGRIRGAGLIDVMRGQGRS